MEIPDISILKPPIITKTLIRSRPSFFAAAISLRIVLFFYGLHQDANSALKYTDIDYFVFTDASRYVARGLSPYSRDTYRYTPLLAWALLPTSWGGWWFSFGKALFAASDIVAGWLMLSLLKKRGLPEEKALIYSSVWLLNPMVATISTRGSSEGLLCAMVMALLWAIEQGHIALAGAILGFAVHFKIYPFIYGVSIFWVLGFDQRPRLGATFGESVSGFFTQDRLMLLVTSMATFSVLNVMMYMAYGVSFVQHTYLHHLTRIDHRHNFSPYNILLYWNSAVPAGAWSFDSLAFLPQLSLSVLAIPLVLAKRDLCSTMFAQTVAFVTFNKVCTSQYFLWYLVLLPLYLPRSSLLAFPRRGIACLVAWVVGQALWLQQGYQLEFLGKSTFVPGLWFSSLVFFAVNVLVLGVIVVDTATDRMPHTKAAEELIGENRRESGADDDDDEIEEITRDKPVAELVSEEMRMNKLKEYMADIRGFVPSED